MHNSYADIAIMKVLLISANTVVEPYAVYPLGLDYVAAALAADHEVACLDMNVVAEDDALTLAIHRFAPDLIGVSLRNIDNTDALNPESYVPLYRRLVEKIRQFCDVPIVLGGSAFTMFPETLMALLDADYGIVGEGERMPQLLDALENGDNPSKIHGVICRSGASTQALPLSEASNGRLSATPAGIDFYLRHGGMLNLQTKRGCPFRCVYCSYPNIEGRVMRHHAPSKIAEDALARQDAGARYLFITDSAFNADPEHSLAVARALKSIGLTIPWGGFFAPMRMPGGYFDILAECGLTHVEFGTEALCDSVLQAYGKPFRVSHVFDAHRAARAAGLHVAHYFLFAGPGESEQTLATSLSRIDRLNKTVLFLFCGMRIYPHTALYELALKQGQIESDPSILEPVFYRSPRITVSRAADMIAEHAKERKNWVHAAGGEATGETLDRMYRGGFSGPLWEYLIR